MLCNSAWRTSNRFFPEKLATLQRLVAARSGIYTSTANPELTDLTTRRGSQAPGTYMQSQHWDVSALGITSAKQTGEDLFNALGAFE